MRLDDLHLWYLGDPAAPCYVGVLQLVAAGKGVSLRYSAQWLASGFALSEDLPLVEGEFLPAGRLAADVPRAVGPSMMHGPTAGVRRSSASSTSPSACP